MVSYSHSRGFSAFNRSARSRLPLLALGLALALGLFCGTGPARADEKPGETPTAAAPAATPDYIIGVDDVLQISAVGQEEINQVVTVLSDGTIRVNGIDEDIKAEGMSVAQLRDILYKGLDKLYREPKISVSVKESHSRNVSIVGARASGQFPLRKGMRVSTLIALAGGLPAKTKLVTGTLIRNFKSTKLDILKIVGANPDPNSDPLLQSNDTVFLDVNEEAPPPSFSVLGAVMKPGNYPLPLDGSTITLSQALAVAGGQTEKASLAHASLLRKNQKIALNLYPLIAENKADCPEAKMLLEDGDILQVPELDAKFMVLGEVNRPATIPLPETQKVTVLDALAQAGGPTNTGDIGKAGIMRLVNGKPEYIKVDLRAMMTRADRAKTMTLQDGDTLYIPTKGRPFSIGDILSPLFLLSALGLRPFGR